MMIPPPPHCSSIDAYLKSFESYDDESCSSDLDDFNDYGSEEEEEVGAVIDDAPHLLKCVFYISIRVLELKKSKGIK
jgi:hypothetical protein